jgi:hypothetical protein
VTDTNWIPSSSSTPLGKSISIKGAYPLAHPLVIFISKVNSSPNNTVSGKFAYVISKSALHAAYASFDHQVNSAKNPKKRKNKLSKLRTYFF